MDRPRFAGDAHGVVVEQIVEPEAAADLAVGVGLLVELDEGAFGEVDQQVFGVEIVEVGRCVPRGWRRRLRARSGRWRTRTVRRSGAARRPAALPRWPASRARCCGVVR